jgi:hypothetical protein
MVVALLLMGRIVWCELGDYTPWTPDAWSSHTSQHLFDPYTVTHLLHGIGFLWISRWILPKLSLDWRLFLVITAEAAWEVIENTSWVIQKYRENTASLDYFGDSVLNSFGDVLACAVGFGVAVKLGWWRSVILFASIEILLLVWIRDSLLLNILMLLFPIEAIERWQTIR